MRGKALRNRVKRGVAFFLAVVMIASSISFGNTELVKAEPDYIDILGIEISIEQENTYTWSGQVVFLVKTKQFPSDEYVLTGSNNKIMNSFSDIKSDIVTYIPIGFQFDKENDSDILFELGISKISEQSDYNKFISCKKLMLNSADIPHYITKYSLMSDIINANYVETGDVINSVNPDYYRTFSGILFVPQSDFWGMSSEAKEIEVGVNVTGPDGKKYVFKSEDKMYSSSRPQQFSVTPEYILGEIGEYKYKAYCKFDECYYYGEEKSFYNSTENENAEYKVSDIYSGFSDIIARKNFYLKSYYSNVVQTTAAVKNEYVTTADFHTSAIFEGISTALDGKKMAEKICNNIINGNYNVGSAEIDSINDKFIKALCDDDTINLTFFMEDDNIGMLKSLLELVKEIDNYNFSEGVRDSNIKSRELIDSLNWLSEKWDIYIDEENNSLLSDVLTKSIDAIDLGLQGRNFLKGYCYDIYMNEVEKKVIDQLLESLPQETLLYKSMKHEREQLDRPFIARYTEKQIFDRYFGKLMGAITNEILESIDNYWYNGLDYIAPTYALCKTTLNLMMEGATQIWHINSFDSFIEYNILEEYVRNMKQYIENCSDKFKGPFVGKDINQYKIQFGYFIKAVNLLKDEAVPFASKNKVYNEEFLENNTLSYENIDYEEYIMNTRYLLNGIVADNFKNKFETLYDYTFNNEDIIISEPSDDIKDNYLYAFEDTIYGNITAKNCQITIPEGINITIAGDLIIEEGSKLNINGNITVLGDFTCYKSETSNNGNMEVMKDTAIKESIFTSNGESLKFDKNLNIYGYHHLWDASSEHGLNLNNGSIEVGGDIDLGTTCSIRCADNTNVHVKGNITFNPGGSLLSDGECHIYIGSDKFVCEGDVVGNSSSNSRSVPFIQVTNDNTSVYLYGNLIVPGIIRTDFSKGKLYFAGNRTHELKQVCLYDTEVINEGIVSLLSDIEIRGKFNTNGCQVIQNDYYIDLYDNAKMYGDTEYDDIRLYGLGVLDFALTTNNINITRKFLDGKDVLITKNAVLNILNDITTPISQDVKILNQGIVNVGNDMNIEYLGEFYNEGIVNVDNNLVLNGSDSRGFISTGETKFINIGKLCVGADVIVKTAGKLSSQADSKISIAGNITGDCDFTESELTLTGTNKQVISEAKLFSTIIISNLSDEGVEFKQDISVTRLFNHCNHKVTLKNNGDKSSFPDYDGDGILDNEDKNPLVFDDYSAGDIVIEEDNNLIVGITDRTSLSELENEIYRKLIVLDSSGNEMKENTRYISTGDVVCFVNNNGAYIKKYEVCIKGDTDGTGTIDVLDMEAIQKSILGIGDKLSGAYKEAASLTDGDDITVLDMEAIQKDILGIQKIN